MGWTNCVGRFGAELWAETRLGSERYHARRSTISLRRIYNFMDCFDADLASGASC